jgi:hypothetical protein
VQDGTDEHFNGVLAANSVASFIDVAREALEVVRFDVLHACVVQRTNVFVDLFVLLVRLEVKVVSPMTKIARDNEQSIVIVKVFG